MPLVATMPRKTWPVQLGVAAATMISALLLTHALWRGLQHTPFLPGFLAAIVSSWIGGRRAGILAVIVGGIAYATFPPPLPPSGIKPLLAGFVLISGTFSWLVASRREIEQHLGASQERLKAVVSGLPVVLWEIDWDGRVTLSAGSGLQVLGLAPRELLGRSIFDIYRDNPEVVANTARVLNGDTFTAITTIGEVTVETWYSPRRDEAGAVTGAIGVSLDVTTRRRLEEQYLQAQKMDAVGQLAAGIAHDFNNLLTAIGGYTELVLVTLEPGDRRREELQEVAKAGLRAGALTRQLLAFSRRQILQPAVLDINGMLADVHKLLRRTIPENIDLHLQMNAVDPIRADPGQLEQVVLNLAINAGDAMPHGGQLRLTTDTLAVEEGAAGLHPPMPAGRYVRLTVTDTGIGMSPETQARIFEPFFSTKERGKGTGLGLATVYGIVKQSEGYIWVDSEVGRGTTFELYLPVVSASLSPAAHVDPASAYSGGTQTVLLAEDDGAVRRLTRDILTSHGYTVLDARDGEEALALARAHPNAINLLIADVVMPGLSGRDLASRLTEERPDVRVLYTSGYNENMMARAGFDRFESDSTLLRKPFLPADLLQRVRETLAAEPI
jgi:two-component system, cell cycle sensor histidine kinase and response regulator CckA